VGRGFTPQPVRWVPKGVYVGTINKPHGDSVGHPTVDIPMVGATNMQTVAVAIDFDPTTAAASGHTHALTGPTFHSGDRVLIAFEGGSKQRPIVLGRCT
jgi:hypothetical protein